ncbi:12069_t:CDS:2 [Ambispora gerdemannii]|uniref:DNA excision repair protein ERCC-1 n=1 Tax=Ambispora gerdemannii TaxID=144530 RepID=A0A9N9F8V8_9GLOM|nr:12069_t:CDS:2 [Ambispora gerdemannii]
MDIDTSGNDNNANNNNASGNGFSRDIFRSTPIKDRGSTFIALATTVTDLHEVEAFKATVRNKEQNATHYVLAYRIYQNGNLLEENDDDGEDDASILILNLLKTLELVNVAVSIPRWFSGILLGPVRFDYFVRCAREALDLGNFSNVNNSNGGGGNEGETNTSQASSSTSSLANRRAGGPIIVNGERQVTTSSTSTTTDDNRRGNPLLQYIRNVPWEYGEIAPDFIVGSTTCALFLSLRYHRLHPEYIFTRIQMVMYQFNLRILLVLVDVDSHQDPIRELTKISVTNNFTIMLAWSQEEAGKYLETFKAFENRPPDSIMEKVESDYHAKLTQCLTQIRSVNKTDVLTLSSQFGSLKNIMSASTDELSTCPGIGDQKIRRLQEAFTQPFTLNKKQRKKNTNK